MIVGLAGGIAVGKSTVADLLKSKGFFVIDADAVYRDLSKEGTELNTALKEAFPDCISDGKLNKTLIYNRVFHSENDRLLLNSLTHPFIIDEIKARLADDKINVVEAALLFESGFDKLCDKIICVTAKKSLRLERLLKRSKQDKSTAQKIINSQLSDKELIKRCGFNIINDGDFLQLKQNVDKAIDWINLTK